MIQLTRLSGSVFLLNADLIERVDSTPDTIVTLVDGKKYVVKETMQDVLDAVLAFRGEIVALSTMIDASHGFPMGQAPQPHLAAVSELPTTRGGDA